ncbi:hypothetical protein HGG82_13100 [Marinomonas sp. M1K-6]|uniref:Uncharacterized protein n=1 Tax=Marinomonas profundi TaxID=2726122 RepID=A0A847R3M5_9GAMM|nr:hypothetical protein [Marinomonas profundi]NLQ18545.1 hypothetical protein [Marinomonas profundi]UDV04417.1 hypothetical protein J8N69_06605 [Marinomonas profundi]
MRISVCSNLSHSLFYGMTVSLVVLLSLLQIAAWYPFLSQSHSEMTRHIRLKEQASEDWSKTRLQAEQLNDLVLSAVPWVTHDVAAEKDQVPTKWSIQGTASIAQWQHLFEVIEAQFALGLLSVDWQRTSDGRWFGRLSFDVQGMHGNRSYHNWLPTPLRAYRFVERDWRLLSTMRAGNVTSALLEYKQHRHWVRKGSWLSVAGLTVSDVFFDRVMLLAKDGAQMALMIREKERADD